MLLFEKDWKKNKTVILTKILMFLHRIPTPAPPPPPHSRAAVVLPNDPDLVDLLAKNGVDISVSEGEQQGNYVALLGNLLFPLIAFAGLFFLFRRAQQVRFFLNKYFVLCAISFANPFRLVYVLSM